MYEPKITVEKCLQENGNWSFFTQKILLINKWLLYLGKPEKQYPLTSWVNWFLIDNNTEKLERFVNDFNEANDDYILSSNMQKLIDSEEVPF